jgi:Xaa-Pro aminopeptidase
LWTEQSGKSTKLHFEFFSLPRDPAREQWDGFRYGPERAKKLVGADEAFPIEKLHERLGAWFSSRKPGTKTTILTNLADHPAEERDFKIFLEKFPFHGRRGCTAPSMIGDARLAIGELRLIKDKDELEIMRKAGKINVKSHLEVLKNMKPGMYEYQMQAIVEHSFQMNGCQDPAYGSICASGANATILHYNENTKRLKEGEMFLIDAGCEHKFYSSDITRTYPVSGKYNKEQRLIMDIVAEAHKEAMEKVRVGTPYVQIHEAACAALVEGLCAIKILKGKPKAELQSMQYRKYYPHGTGHWLGLDTHDPNPYTDEKGNPMRLDQGMVCTIEPGLYFLADDKTVPAEFRGIGVRIEDDVVVTKAKPEVLTEGLPRYASEIEKFMSRRP